MDTRMEGTGCPPCSSAPNLTPNPSPAPVSAPAYSLASPPPKKPFRLEKGERPAALLCLLMGIAYVRLLLDPPEILRPWGDWSNWLLAILLVSFFVCVELSARLCHLPCPRESWFWAAVMLAQPLGCGLFENDALSLFPYLFSHLAAAQWALVRCGGAAALPVGALLPLDLVRGWFGIPFSNFHRLFQTIFYGAGKKLPKPKSKGVWWGLLGAVCVLPVLVWAFSTLVNADAAFQNLAGMLQHLASGIFLQAMFHLKQEAFPQIPCPHTGRLEILYHFQQSQHMLLRNFHPHAKSQIINNAFHIAAQITVIVNVPNDVFRHLVV